MKTTCDAFQDAGGMWNGETATPAHGVKRTRDSVILCLYCMSDIQLDVLLLDQSQCFGLLFVSYKRKKNNN